MNHTQDAAPTVVAAQPAAGPRSRSVRLRKKLLALALGLSLALLILEVGTRIIFPAPPNPYRAPQIVYRPDPELGYVHVPGEQGWIDDGWVTINSLGLRDTELREKQSDESRVFVIGDSVTLGWGVNDDETFCRQLGERLRQGKHAGDIRIINGGVSGYDTSQEARFLRRIGPVVDPDVVLIGFYWNDLLGPISLQRANPQSNDVLRMTPKHGWFRRTLRHSRSLYIAGRYAQSWLADGEWGAAPAQTAMLHALLSGAQTQQVKTAWKKVETELQSIDDLARRNKWRIGFLVLPPREQVAKQLPNAEYQTRIREIATRLGWFVVDPLPRLAAHPGGVDELFIPYDQHHLSKVGHKLVAEEILDFARKHPGILWPENSK
jgi:lysophospholipase L1-like esterase